MGQDKISGGVAELFEQHRAELLRFLAARCGERDDARDLLHELWIKSVTKKLGPISNGRAYLFRMANNLVVDHARARHRAMARDRDWLALSSLFEKEDRQDPGLLADEVIVERQKAEVFERAIAALPPGAQRALRLYRLDGLGQAEIGRIMGISRSGVEKHLALAMKHLSKSLVDCGWLDTGASPTTEEAGRAAIVEGNGHE